MKSKKTTNPNRIYANTKKNKEDISYNINTKTITYQKRKG